MAEGNGVTVGAIQQIFSRDVTPPVGPADYQPILEVRGVRQVNNRWCVQVADQVHAIRSVVFEGSDVHQAVSQNKILPGTLVKLIEYNKFAANRSQILGMIKAEVVGVLRQDQRLPDNLLMRFMNAEGTQELDAGMSQVAMTQVVPVGSHAGRSTGSGSTADAYATPERRAAVGTEQTPTPVGRSSVQNMDPSFAAEADTQPNPYAKPTDPGFRQQPSSVNPYSSIPGVGSSSAGAVHSPQPAAAAMRQDGLSGTGLARATLPSQSQASRGIANITPVAGLNSYLGNKWTIKARVLTKGEVRKFTNARGEGQLMKVDLGDQSGEVSATFFGKAVDKWINVIQPGQVYTFSKGQVKPANKRYDRGDHVIIFEEHAQIEAAGEDQAIPGVVYEFKPLCDISNMEVETLVDVKAVIYAAQDPMTFMAKTKNREMTKREISLWDPSGPSGYSTMELTLWGERALGNQYEVGTVVFLKRARISEWQDQKTLSSPVQMELNPDHEDSFMLLRMFKESQASGAVPSRSQARVSMGSSGTRQTLEACREEDVHLAMGSAAPAAPGEPRTVHRHTVVATLTTLPTDRGPYYPSCPAMVDSKRPPSNGQPPQQRSCNKKVNQESDGMWHCAGGHSCENPVYRYLCRMNILDHTEDMEVNIYDDVARSLLGLEAGEYRPVFEAGQACEREDELRRLNRKMEWRKCCLRLRAQKEVWQEAERIRYSVDEAQVINFAKEAQQMLGEIKHSLSLMPLQS
eukprot:TRINITY_DN35301_c0_g1_i1.p1 TRINITY_DN35301_c0_g1~~TRINITY_DN35301_c0_g1_i1.p1  ORF type:complete len:770 (-),score=146.46 TRINITY_DN35301_c0_g1_i1:148-2382(-)